MKSWKVEIAATGRWNSSTAGWVDITKEHLDGIVDAFHDLKDTVKPMLKLGHNEKQPLIKGAKDGHPAFGWADQLEVVGDKLIATFRDVPDILRKAIEAKRYSRVSVEIQPNVKVSGKTYKNVLTAVGLLGADIPAINTLADLQTYMSHGDFADDPIVYTTKTNDKEEFMSEKLELEIATLKAEKAQLQADYKVELAEQTTKIESLTKEIETFTAAQKEADAEKAKADFTAAIEQNVKDGTMTPAQRDNMISLFTPEAAPLLMKQIAVFSAGAKVIDLTRENGKGNNQNAGKDDSLPADKKVLKLATARAAKDSINLSQAIELTLSEDDELAREYIEINDGGAV